MLPLTLYISCSGPGASSSETSPPNSKDKTPTRTAPCRAVRVTLFHQPYISQRSKNPSIKPFHLSTFVLVLVPPLKTPNSSASYLGFSRFLLHPQTGPVPVLVPVPGQSGMRGHEYATLIIPSMDLSIRLLSDFFRGLCTQLLSCEASW